MDFFKRREKGKYTILYNRRVTPLLLQNRNNGAARWEQLLIGIPGDGSIGIIDITNHCDYEEIRHFLNEYISENVIKSRNIGFDRGISIVWNINTGIII